ncbi:hypothetical protein LMG28727_06527 [Paraburkholderia kirstenboschensis]|uniref:hypothetical protein n=1 Tax=Paraburkholderia kirstenboschensis TaxID=1245436 RepID=UPI001919C344|nr:hypothetical protein [Paraburkholderia kirstenboschensis]CAD6558119.1 hypothetical protein LMG28727_06527 [Paraburkholderia kirstenboschensis]
MEISSNLLTTQDRSAPAVKSTAAKGPSLTGAAAYATVSTQTATQTDSVTLSGRALMLSRLYGSEQRIPASIPEFNDNTVGLPLVDWLTDADRDTLSDMYSYAQQQGADLNYVDDIAFDMGMYRRYSPSEANINDGGTYDSGGHQLSVSFGKNDTAAADSIMNGDAIRSTKVDKGFLKYELDPGFSPNHSANFKFLGQMVDHFSDAKTKQPLSPEFSTFTIQKEATVVHGSKEVTESMISDFTVNGGVFTLTEHGKKNGWILDAQGRPVPKDQQSATTSRIGDKKSVQSSIKPPQSLGLMLLALLKNATSAHKPRDVTHDKKA